jgi:malonyl-CoA O-methyltransferase
VEFFVNKLADLRSAFDRLAPAFEDHAALEREVGSRLAERTSFKRLEPERILDLGCRTGYTSALLKRSFRRAEVVGLEASPAMLSRLRRKSGFRRPLRAACGELGALPFSERCADLVFSNLNLHWLPQPAEWFEEVRRVLRTDGMFLFSALGPSSLEELRRAEGKGLPELVVPDFADLLDIGDALMASGFSEPVMDMERLTLDYPSAEALVRELEATGLSLLVGGWSEWKRWLASEKAARDSLRAGERYPVGFEVIYGTAFGPSEGQPRRTAGGDEVRISVDSLLKSRTMG